jgi:hypothetical protein
VKEGLFSSGLFNPLTYQIITYALQSMIPNLVVFDEKLDDFWLTKYSK